MTDVSSYPLVLTPDVLREATADTVTTVVSSRSMTFTIADGEISGDALAVGLNSGASLIRRRGGDALERAAFAWLFATGQPQEGLDAFLHKRAPHFRRDVR